ncbi:50S ribosomal protein L11 methyltransferase [uncultured Desulfuromonas sp.]|uniref:50S ribosomal protein L11 methyltransferase n=2 Tax=Desulfuromonas TaxID=890 RepID=UPI002612F6E0|nr:50S ribosomal protein L11 methyltransferase [uncultured Desulfuromonas sp.]
MGRTFQPFTVGHRFRITPPEGGPSRDSRLDLVMAAGAFGSGEHETTASCLEILETMPEVQGARVLDLGSGTGILTIAALKLGAKSALCIDIEASAVEACRENCKINGVEERVEHMCGTLDDVGEGSFDLILANIYGDILLQVAENLVAFARPAAPLLLSGMLWEYNFPVRQKYERLGCRISQNRMLEEFSTLLLHKA